MAGLGDMVDHKWFNYILYYFRAMFINVKELNIKEQFKLKTCWKISLGVFFNVKYVKFLRRYKNQGLLLTKHRIPADYRSGKPFEKTLV